jgi:lipopolysaccharide export system protein LptC
MNTSVIIALIVILAAAVWYIGRQNKLLNDVKKGKDSYHINVSDTIQSRYFSEAEDLGKEKKEKMDSYGSSDHPQENKPADRKN